MRKYECLKTSLFLDENLKMIDLAQRDIDAGIKEGIFPAKALKQKLLWIYYMLHMRRTISLARRGGHVSLKDYYLLIELWFLVFLRKYCPEAKDLKQARGLPISDLLGPGN